MIATHKIVAFQNSQHDIECEAFGEWKILQKRVDDKLSAQLHLT